MKPQVFDYHRLDVFTERALSGNPLAVVLGAETLDTAAMQAIAREFNLSETVFVLPPRLGTADVRLRIFTPARELPFAGHPTIGAACLLAELEPQRYGAGQPLVLEEEVGPIAVSLKTGARRAIYARFSVAQKPQIRPLAVSAEDVAPLLGLRPGDLMPVTPSQPLLAVSCGLEFVLIPLKSGEALERAAFADRVPAELRTRLGCESFYLYQLETAGSDIRARMFSAGLGVAEDPATGSAAAALAAALASRSGLADGCLRWNISQGVEMRRPSRLDVEVDKQQHSIVAVRVGGHALRIASGQLYL